MFYKTNSERSLVQIQAMVMLYDNNQKEWIFAGVSEGNSKVQIFHHPTNNTFRVVARKLVDHEVSEDVWLRSYDFVTFLHEFSKIAHAPYCSPYKFVSKDYQ